MLILFGLMSENVCRYLSKSRNRRRRCQASLREYVAVRDPFDRNSVGRMRRTSCSGDLRMFPLIDD